MKTKSFWIFTIGINGNDYDGENGYIYFDIYRIGHIGLWLVSKERLIYYGVPRLTIDFYFHRFLINWYNKRRAK